MPALKIVVVKHQSEAVIITSDYADLARVQDGQEVSEARLTEIFQGYVQHLKMKHELLTEATSKVKKQ